MVLVVKTDQAHGASEAQDRVLTVGEYYSLTVAQAPDEIGR